MKVRNLNNNIREWGGLLLWGKPTCGGEKVNVVDAVILRASYSRELFVLIEDIGGRVWKPVKNAPTEIWVTGDGSSPPEPIMTTMGLPT